MSALPRGGEPTTARCKWLAFATLLVSTCAWPRAAGALPTDINLSPQSGPVGTTVTVSGSGCGPGLLSGTSSVRVLSATLSVDVTVSANAAGSWSTQFVVPSDAVQLTHAIAATCVQDLVPVPYLPQSFTVVAAPTPTTHGASASDSGVASGSPTGRPSGGGVTGAQPASTTAGPSSSSTSAPPSADSEVAAGRVEASRTGTGAVAFDSAARSRWTWLGWVAWAMAIVAVAAAAIAAVWFTWLRHTRARLWWERWLQQVARLRGLGRS